MSLRRKLLIAVPASVLTLAAIVTGALVMTTRAEGGTAAGAVKRTIYMSALEYKGSTTVAKEPCPTDPAPPGGGYIITLPPDCGDPAATWSTSTYRWEPGTIVVNRGDEVELRIWGVNGKLHDAEIEGYVPNFTVQRGELTVVNFTATRPGTFRIICHTHMPSMEAQLVVQLFRSIPTR